MEIEVDNHKLMYHPKRVSDWVGGENVYPIYVEIGPTNACNHRCIFCALDFLGYKKNFIDKDVMNETLEDMAEHGVKSVMFAGEGEPLLHRNIREFVENAKKYGMDVSITTNGVPFRKSKAERILPNLSWIRFSVDAATKENYAKIHGTTERNFEIIMSNIKNAVEMKKNRRLEVEIGVQFLMIPNNVHEVTKLAEIVKKIEADNLQIKPYSQHPLSSNRFVIDYKDYAHLEEELKKFDSERFHIYFRKKTMQRLRDDADYKCMGLPFFALIDAKGNVLPCNLYYGNEEVTYGNLYEKKFSEIWCSDRRKEILEKLMEKDIKECRKGCRLDVINRYLHRLKNPQSHDNFI